ncbi:MAG: hypothetical protein SGPRY_012813 [Prymnesium sp.]
MPPKGKGKDKKAGKPKKKDGEPGDAELSPAELLVQAKLRIESLERQLVWREEKLQAALSAQRELKEQVAQYHDDFEREKTEIFDISADMTRQYKGMQEELLQRLNSLENQISAQKDQLEMSRLQLDEVRAEKAQELAKKDAEIAEQQLKMEDMAVEFGEMLKEVRAHP